MSPMLEYVFSLAMAAPSRDFRHKLVAVLAKVYRSLATPDFVGLSRCLAHLNDAKAVTELDSSDSSAAPATRSSSPSR